MFPRRGEEEDFHCDQFSVAVLVEMYHTVFPTTIPFYSEDPPVLIHTFSNLLQRSVFTCCLQFYFLISRQSTISAQHFQASFYLSPLTSLSSPFPSYNYLSAFMTQRGKNIWTPSFHSISHYSTHQHVLPVCVCIIWHSLVCRRYREKNMDSGPGGGRLKELHMNSESCFCH